MFDDLCCQHLHHFSLLLIRTSTPFRDDSLDVTIMSWFSDDHPIYGPIILRIHGKISVFRHASVLAKVSIIVLVVATSRDSVLQWGARPEKRGPETEGRCSGRRNP